MSDFSGQVVAHERKAPDEITERVAALRQGDSDERAQAKRNSISWWFFEKSFCVVDSIRKIFFC